MTNLSRKIASTAAAVAIAAGLVAGVATPAMAGPFPPINPGPSVPSLPPGTVIQPVVQFPSCATALSSTGLYWADHFTPGFRLLASSTGVAGAPASLAGVASANRHFTCVFGKDWAHPYYLTSVAISTSDYNWLFQQYDYNIVGPYWSYFHAAAPGQPGYNARLWGTSADAAGNVQYAVLSPSGWWITESDHGNSTYVNTIEDATQQFLAIQPWRG
jgi:hypothetical protein